jgi:hypothetical protein
MRARWGFHAGWLGAALFLLAQGSAANAARQGEIGATSTGSITISVSVAPRARISGLQDIEFGPTDPATGARRAQTLCVWSNSPAGSYSLTAAGSGPGGAFELSSGRRTVNYSVEWATSAGQTAGRSLSGGATRTNLQATATGADCAEGAGSASLAVALSPTQLAAAEPGSAYSGALTLIVSPQ